MCRDKDGYVLAVAVAATWRRIRQLLKLMRFICHCIRGSTKLFHFSYSNVFFLTFFVAKDSIIIKVL